MMMAKKYTAIEIVALLRGSKHSTFLEGKNKALLLSDVGIDSFIFEKIAYLTRNLLNKLAQTKFLLRSFHCSIKEIISA